ncbi:bifunctional nuclease family protein [Kaistella daneshvariae]|jgi:bifunctional DNase/RNase|uniref:Bifunctional nuclease family protein n=1 Tax=Kaistella daneshvariae TaxID=2487074 RepID=A0A3N0WZ98_9FLAO|nr:bifunctional nuclease family protein [Kaistella daneshvariae]AZI68192.1 bifunctional nuclease family protein [Kaistella daneshvariae]ROI10392.1 bifunctional nuclease family protein [Kaistella daneshvariae]
MDYKKLTIRGISYSQTQSGAYALLLEHEESNVKLPVVIGNFEAQAISLGLEKDIHPPRPLTHDLFSKFISSANYEITSVIIYQIIDGVFFSNINFKNKASNEELIMDARTSDAVAMAVRFEAPIYTTQQVLSEAGILLELEDVSKQETTYEEVSEGNLSSLTLEDLHKLLEDAVKDEDFDAALEIQEEIKRRKKKID